MTSRTAPPLRTWRPMILWSAGILLALGLAWFVAAMVVPVWRLARQLEGVQEVDSRELEAAVQALGGRTAVVRSIRTYMNLPECLASKKEQAILLLGACGQEGVPLLTAALAGDQKDCRIRALVALSMIGADAQSAVPSVAAMCYAPDRATRSFAITALGSIGAGSPEAVETLIKMLNQDFEARGFAVTSLGLLEASAEPAIPELVKFLGDTYHGQEAAHALSRIGHGAVGPLTEYLKNGSPSARKDAAWALYDIVRRLGPQRLPELIEPLLAALGDEEVNSTAALALAVWGRAVLPRLKEKLASADAEERAGAVWALQSMNADAQEAVPDLLKVLSDKDWVVRAGAVKALRQVAPKSPEVQAALKRMLNDECYEVRKEVTSAP